MVKEHPILFSTPMVQAITEGRKTMTRRIIKCKSFLRWVESGFSDDFIKDPDNAWANECPYGKVGDLLYVKETWATNGLSYFRYKADYQKEADGINWDDTGFRNPYGKWKPSLFMPKEAARIWLEITDVKVERLQEISEDDAIREGVEDLTNGQQLSFRNYLHNTHPLTAKGSFKSLWQSINGEESWELNPYVWVLCFKPKNTILKTN